MTPSKSTRRGRPPLSPTDIEAGKQRIAEAARRLFYADGYGAVSMRRLAQEAEVTPKTLYSYFGSKNAILQHIWSDFFSELFDELDTLARKRGSPGARLRAVALRYIDYWVAHPERYRMVFMAEGVSQGDVGSYMNATSILGRYQVFATLLTDLAPDAPRVQHTDRLNALICALNGIVHNTVTISGHNWGKPKVLLEILLTGITHPHTHA